MSSDQESIQRPSHVPANQLETNPPQTRTEKRIRYLLEKYFHNDPEQRPVLERLVRNDPSHNGKYHEWLVRNYCKAWKPTDLELQATGEDLAIHLRGSKYFSPLTWTGLLLEDAGYLADISRYTPKTLEIMRGPIAEIIRVDEENKQIRKGNLVATEGAEVVHRDERWTLVRIRTGEALRKLGQGTSWCVRHGHVSNGLVSGYRFPFDFLLSSEGERYLANGREVKDRWNNIPGQKTLEEIDEVRAGACDSFDRLERLMEGAITSGQRLDEAVEGQILKYPNWAIRYAEALIAGGWDRFEQEYGVRNLSASLAVEYAIRCRRDRWVRFENKIKRTVEPLARYRSAFPNSIPKTDKEFFREAIQSWRYSTPGAREMPRYGMQVLVEARERNLEEELSWFKRTGENSHKRFAKLFASLLMSPAGIWYTEKVQSYFESFDSELGRLVNLRVARFICKHFRVRQKSLESRIATDAVCSLNYALGIGERFLEGEAEIKKDRELWAEYQTHFFGDICGPIKRYSPRVQFPDRGYQWM